MHVLPSHPDVVCADPLSVCDEPFPTSWHVFVASVEAYRAHRFNLDNLPDLVKDLAYSLHGNGKVDTGFLSTVIRATYPAPADDQANAILENIFRSALALPTLFPDHSIPYLRSEQPMLDLTRSQVMSLVCHQLLCTLKPPEGNTWGCTLLCWFSRRQPLKHVVHGYLATLFHYIRQRPYMNRTIRYEFVSLPSLSRRETDAWLASDVRLFDFLEIEAVNTATDEFPPSLKCVLISSNASPGFGPACTQEELITAACPDLLPLGALCVSPPVPPNAALIAQGILPMSSWRGHRREARLVDLLDPTDEYTFLFLDAAELDLEPHPSASLVDLDPRFFLRDLYKCYVGFNAIRQKGITKISAPVWGAGAFGADPVIKTLILTMGGALAGLIVRLAIDTTRLCQSASGGEIKNLLQVVRTLKTQCAAMNVHQLWTLLSGDERQNYADGLAVAQRLLIASADATNNNACATEAVSSASIVVESLRFSSPEHVFGYVEISMIRGDGDSL